MRLLLLLAFLGVPILEIAVFIEVGGWIGLWPTLGLVVLTAIVGTYELRAQGLATMNRLQRELHAGIMPAQTLFDGVCLLFAGALLLTPGFVTDAVGLLLFLPSFRRFLRVKLGGYIMRHARVHVHGTGTRRGGRDARSTGASEPIDADYVDITDHEAKEDDDSQADDEPPRRLR